MKTIKLVLLTLALLGLTPVVQAQFTYVTNGATITITGYTGSNGVVAIPGTLAGLPVTGIGEWAFYTDSVTSVLVSDSVTNVGDGAFFNCQSLTNVTLGNSVSSIGDWAFAFCPGLINVCCRGNVPSLEGDNVFYGNLATIYYLSGATNWGPTFDSHPAVLWNPFVPYDFTTNNGAITIREYTGSDVAIAIPSKINFLPVTGIGNSLFSAFSAIGPNEVQIPESVTNIGSFAFAWSGLTTITIPNSVDAIADHAFLECYSLTNATIPTNVIRIGNNAFNTCYGLTNLMLLNGLANIESNAFANCQSLANIIIPESVTNLGDGAFAGCIGLTNVTILNGLTIIPKDGFTFCTGLTTFTIPDSVTTIDENAFGACDALTTVFIPSSVTNVETWAFNFCPVLKNVYFTGNAPSLVGLDVFYASPDVIAYYLPTSTGWDATFSDAPTALWLPQTQNANASQAQPFGFNIQWVSGQTVVVDACTNLSNPDWQSVQTNRLTTDSVYFNDPQWTNYSSRYYRLRSQ